MLSRLLRLTPNLSRVCQSVPSRSMASVPKRGISYSAASQKLLRIVSSEFDHEQSNYAIDESFQPFLEKAQFTLVENENSPLITLHKEVGNQSVNVTFLARTPDSSMEDEAQYEGDQQQDFHDFQVAIQKTNSKNSILFECSTQQSEITILALTVTSKLDKINPHNVYLTNKEYRGPEINTLDDKLQASLIDYLESLGVDDQMGNFIESYSLDKEQRLYMEWLGNFKQFL